MIIGFYIIGSLVAMGGMWLRLRELRTRLREVGRERDRYAQALESALPGSVPIHVTGVEEVRPARILPPATQRGAAR